MAILQKTLTTILASSIFAISSFAAVDNNQENESCNFSINDAWIRPAQSGNTALYMNIKANTDAGKDASLISASVYSLTNDGKAIPDVTGDVEFYCDGSF
jgi:copper(I)-binding protein